MPAEQFKNWRSEMGFTLKQVADELGLLKTTVENYDKGTRREDGGQVKIARTVFLHALALNKTLRHSANDAFIYLCSVLSVCIANQYR